MADKLVESLPTKGVVLIRGKAGIGKTYLAHTLCAAYGDLAPAVVEFDALKRKGAKAVLAGEIVTPYTLLLTAGSELDALAASAVVDLFECKDGSVIVSLSHYVGYFKLH